MLRLRLFLVVILTLIASEVSAVRPFITDDARVVGYFLGQYETWLRFDQHAWQHWNMIAFGPTERWELALGFYHGVETTKRERDYSFAIPLLQAKYLINEYKPNSLPGFAIAAGTFLPGGKGSFKAPGYGGFAYLAATQCFGHNENILIHGNIGFNHVNTDETKHTVITSGLGTQVKAIGGLHLMGEIFSGDPYIVGSGFAYQTGIRHFVSDFVQIDLTLGEGISGQNKLPFWYGMGVRLVTDRWVRPRREKKSTING